MTAEEYHTNGVTEHLEEIRRTALSIEEKVDEVLEGLQDLLEADGERRSKTRGWEEYWEDREEY